jgi:hypothetical protein
MICPIGTYPSPYQTCHHRRFQQWVRTGGVFEKILQTLATDLRERGGLDLSECYIDCTFIVAKKEGGTKLEGPPSRGAKVRRRSWQYQIVLAFLPPYTLRLLLRRIRKSSPLLKQLLYSTSVFSLLLMKNHNVCLIGGDKGA